jgi:hypothetical protein
MFRFTIRDLLWLMVVVGLAVGWWVERTRLTGMLAVTRNHASELREELLSAQWHYAPSTHSKRGFGSGGSSLNFEWIDQPIPGDVKWEMTEQPIP